ncbi:MAG: hypothetical protein ACRDON_04340 [Gaiellaceae bacterium]
MVSLGRPPSRRERIDRGEGSEVDVDEEAGNFFVDERYRRKRPDWTYDDAEPDP